jgi:hypothetical protein
MAEVMVVENVRTEERFVVALHELEDVDLDLVLYIEILVLKSDDILKSQQLLTLIFLPLLYPRLLQLPPPSRILPQLFRELLGHQPLLPYLARIFDGFSRPQFVHSLNNIVVVL